MPANTPLILLCPGQGAQHVGMGRAWHQSSSAARQTFDEACQILGQDLAPTCFEGPEEQVHRTDFAQAGIYVTSIACFRALVEQQVISPESLTAAAGLSLGEYTALHLAGVLSFADGLRLVHQRGQFMQEAAEAIDSGMVAVIGAEDQQVQALCTAAAGGEVLVAANFNCPGQVVVSGTSAACGRCLQEAEKLGMRATALTVAGAFHSPLMQPAADRMAQALEQVDFHPPRVPVLSNVTGEPHDPDPGSIRSLLVQQITSAVHWARNMQWLGTHHAQ
ncbi:MAG: ACP S-malonyltransferase, partial [Phycisphaerae bacterium]|nr:ACP S-malonyltransferase [Phycisphaerae bacterium]